MTESSGDHKLNQRELMRDRWLPALAVIVTVIISVTAASYNVGEKIGRVEARLGALEVFANQGDRWTAKDGLETRAQVQKLSDELRELPPDWFEKQHDETREDVKELSVKVSQLQQAVNDLMTIVTAQHEEVLHAR